MKSIALPADVIFNIYRLEYHEYDANVLSLSHVCRPWRDVLQRFPDFWAKIDLYLGGRNPEFKALYWAKRAGQKPLKIHVRSDSQRPVAHRAIVRTGLVLRSCMDRWDTFTMDARSREIEHLLPICTGCTPRLRNFSLSCRPGSPEDPMRLLVPFLPSVEPPSDSSRLFVSIHSYIPRFTTFGVGITRLSVNVSMDPDHHSFDLNDLFSIFQSCPNLIEFDFSALGSEHTGPASFDGFIVLRRLTNFSVSWVWNIEDVLNVLRLPALESITLHEVNWSDAARAALWNVLGLSHSLSSVLILQDDDYSYERNPVPFHGNPLTLSNVAIFHMWGNWTLLQPLLDLLTLPHVQELDLAGASIRTAHRLISFSTNLRSLSLRNLAEVPADLDPTPNPAPAPILFPSLTSLHISGFPLFFNYINAPKLGTLALENRFNSACIVNSGAFLRVVPERSASALTTLRLSGLDAGDKDIQWCLERLPALEELSILACAISDSLLSALASLPVPNQSQNTDWILPRLKRFTFDENDHITPSGAIKFLASRTLNPVPGITGHFGFKHLSHRDATAIMSYGSFLAAHHDIVYHMNLEDDDED
ncbi:hypothetical protein BOTBODRAFT_175648 [Botryobasidium botryosum FD-172 SS1]|uniref:F-box domain-containing protein n=1 Tax=Botryobasidium botryosum (strain FD-172 SS1) TaxID=930990 RepID=A0A067MFA6_BOTB1|nr:hypothetical protein BOTBODRAFT_175648 [Botryobasidium botryosum FD-172 SS1]